METNEKKINRVKVGYNNYDLTGDEYIDPATVEATGTAEPTSRVLDGSYDAGYNQEWQEPAVLPDGRRCNRMYLFTDEEVEAAKGDNDEYYDYAENLPFDNDHVSRIILVD